MRELGGSPGTFLARLFNARIAGWAAMLGGLLWLPYGLFTMLQPSRKPCPGPDVGRFARDRGAVATAQQLRGSDPFRLGLPCVALGGASLVGVIAFFDPLFTAGRIFGTLALGVATTMVAVIAREADVERGWTMGLLLLGALGVFLLPLWPLVHALQWVTPGQGALFIALFGIGWLAVGYRLLREAKHPGHLPVA